MEPETYSLILDEIETSYTEDAVHAVLERHRAAHEHDRAWADIVESALRQVELIRSEARLIAAADEAKRAVRQERRARARTGDVPDHPPPSPDPVPCERCGEPGAWRWCAGVWLPRCDRHRPECDYT